MTGRQIGTVVAAAVYGTLHYTAVVGELVRKAGWTNLPDLVQQGFELAFTCSVVIVLGFLVPKILRANIVISTGVLAGLAWCGNLADRVLEEIRLALIFAAERTASWLRGREDDAVPGGPADER